MSEIKEQVLSLLKDYSCIKCENSEECLKKKNECVDKLFILLYYHPHAFGITMSKDVMSDFLSQLYPKFIENMFIKYDETKSNFYTFVNVCLKYQMNFFLQKNLKESMDESVLLRQLEVETAENEVVQSEQMQNEIPIEPECSSQLELTDNYEQIESKTDEQDQQMKQQLQSWFSDKTMSTKEKYKKRAVFILLCKAPSYVDDDMLSAINNYLKMPESLLYYFVERFNKAFANCNKEIESAEYRQNKYFIRYLHTAHLLQMYGKTEYEKSMLEKRLAFSLKHYLNASNFIKNKLKSVSNRTIATITGFSRSCVDRVCLNIKNLLEDIKIENNTEV